LPLYFNTYLAKHNFKPKIEKAPSPLFSIAIVIPCFNEPDIINTLESLWLCSRPVSPVEIMVVVNYPEESNEKIVKNHSQTITKIEEWASNHRDKLFCCHIIDAPNLPKKFAGVGLARKIGMDEAICRFSEVNNEEGIICGFDADATVDNNYFVSIEDHFKRYPKSPGASIYYEHPLEPIDDNKLKIGIIQYEIHLRYLVNCSRYTGFPYAFHTVGSSFAVKAKAYVKQGGMNRFKAGEDFYFINKIIPLGGYTEINTTTVHPQARVSNRVPFGTGASMMKWMESDRDSFLTYQFQSFLPLKKLFSGLENIYNKKAIHYEFVQNEVLWRFLIEGDYENALSEILINSGSLNAFTKRFFTWFDAFKIVKYLNFASLNGYDKKPVISEANHLLSYYKKPSDFDMHNLLEIYRQWDRSGV